ncbi:unnamed protein product [Lasius platythorax]|uniref:Uncharacterized protein n=1 Tax=Lasius platythorax TaxID=488582 RepID=A0AAV2P4W9_9HYME
MAIGEIIILSAVLFARTLSAPSGCIESCDFYQTSYQSRQTSGGYQDHAGLVQGSTNLNDHDYARPGNWTERNQYNTDGGHGKVHEERGQYVEGPKRVRYYKKNFTSSYGNVGANVDGVTELGGQRRYDSLHIPSNQHLESQATQSGQTVTKESGYSRVHSQQSSTRIDGKSEKLEDFGEYGGHSQQHGVNVQTVETTPDNWSRVDSYRTDGGNGRVFEEEGQYVTGPKKVRYYKKNYTSSYSTSGDAGSATTLDKLHSELQRNVHEDLDKFRREFHQQTASTAGLTQEAVHSSFHGNDLQTAESENTYGHQQLSGYRRLPSTGTVRHYTDQQHTETFADTERQRPTANTYGTESQRTYQSHETHVSRAHPAAPQPIHLPAIYPVPVTGAHPAAPQPIHLPPPIYPVPVTGGNYQTASYSHSGGHHVDEIQRAEVSDAHQSGVAQNRLLTERVYNPNPNYGVYPGRRDESRHYQEERWQSSSSHGGNLAPERSADLTLHGVGGRTHYDRDAYNEQRGRYHSSTAQGYDSHVGSSYSSAYGTSSGQKLVAAGSSLDLGRAAHGADCTEETHQQYQQESSYHRKYKRDDYRARQDQEFEPDSEKLDLTNASNQQSEDFTQHDEEFGQQQQTEGQLEFGQQQQTEGQLEFGQQQQTEGQLEFGQQQQTEGQLEFSQQQQTEGQLEFGQQQQTEGQLEFGQQTVDDQHLNDFTQQSEQFAQQMQGSDHLTQQQSDKLNFGQQIVGDQHLEDLTQQNEQFTQETEGQLEFGQQTFSDQDLTQHNKQFMQQESNDHTQQTSKLEFGQQIVGNQRLEDLTQQNKQFTQETEGQLEFGQQTFNDQHLTQHNEQSMQQDYDDLTQQTSGKLEFGQQNVGNQQLEDLKQQTEQFETAGSDDYTQQAVDKLEFGQQTDDTQQLTQQTEHFVQQAARSEDLTQQTSSKLEFGQQTVDDQHLGDSTQQIIGKLQLQSIDKPSNPKNQHLEEFDSKDFSQQAGGHNDFTQQTVGHLEFGQHGSSNPKIGHHSQDFTQNKDLTQQIGGFDDFTQQGRLEYEQRQQSQKPNWPGYNTQHSEQFSQQDDWNTDDLSQQSRRYPSYDNDNSKQQSEWQLDMSQKTEQDFTQQPDDDQQIARKPAPKPKPRQRYQKQDSIPSHTDGTETNLDDIFEPIEVNPKADRANLQGRTVQHNSRLIHPGSDHRSDIPYAQNQRSSVFDNEKENMDRLHWLHKSNDATVGLQWHYTYHPSDLTNIESSHNSYYPHHNVNSMSQQTEDTQQQQSRPFDFSQQETQDKQTFDQDTHVFQTSQAQRNEHDQQLGSFQQTETSDFDGQFNQNSEQIPLGVIPLQNLQQTSTQTTEQTEHKIESRILEAYGGGPYASRNDDIYRRVRPNPSATLPPIADEDPWDIREKPREMIIPLTANTLPVASTPNVTATSTTETTEITTQIIEATTMEAPPSFWNRLGHKITRTYDKAKEKAKEYFG